jgi:acyl CoA:acetate/3-ketoacid CoA transferase beta subunit
MLDIYQAVFNVHPETGLELIEVANDETAESVRAATGCDFKVS